MKLLITFICIINIIYYILKYKEMKFNSFTTEYNILNKKFKILDILISISFSILFIIIFFKEYVSYNLVFLVLPIVFFIKYLLKEYGLKKGFIIRTNKL